MTDKQESEPNEPTTVPQAPPPPKPPSVEELVASQLAALPSLPQDALTVVMTVLATYVGTPTLPVIKVDNETALMELDLTKGWDRRRIKASTNALMEALAESYASVAIDFEKLTGLSTRGLDFEAFASRYTEEREEQSALAGEARRQLEMVKILSGQLGIVNPDPGAQPAKKESKPGFVERLADAVTAAGIRGASPFVEFQKEEDERDLKSPPGWLTDSVLDPDDRDVLIMNLVKTRLEQSQDVSLVWQHLERLSLNRETVTEILRRVSERARKQLDQSKDILTKVEADYRDFEGRLRAIQDLRKIIIAVHSFFFPDEQVRT
ncbi:hypothetical protein A2771_04465 [Candidatus Woesebacteria bacterium RIFCSPHIGHO2_01_FULL_38_26b]|uniref:Uncharacterized protein n=1 Tax=Candidatus Woesebacteria bacterium RIFCSPHIGHO2_01_FULL_38_26b TaxID=1802491 RepID=A0A1F7Y2I7_9BACT|nr:MAG: hypothetical protein A2771_04465 [Candidatus Woesebacteria bacterium RIFCSPHIGHO2_01_FULL_38_26b]